MEKVENDNERVNPNFIKLPAAVEVFANLKNAQKFAIDIGLCLTKIAYYSTINYRKALYENAGLGNSGERAYRVHEGNRLHFVKFETRYIENCLDFVKENLVNVERFHGKSIKVTGGGAYKYNGLLQEKLGLIVDKEDEFACLIKGCNFLLKNIPYEAFEYERHGNPEYKFQKATPSIFPYMLVNIGSGVSILKVESDEVFERVGGTATGGGTFWGLGCLLTNRKGRVKPLFLRHEGYLGAIGAFLYGAEKPDELSWLENYAGSSGFKDSIPTDFGIKVDQLEIDQAEYAVTFCPLLKDPASYNPDTTDLAQDKEARDYWLQCFEESVDKFVAKAIHSQPHSPTAEDRASKLKEKYVNRLHYLHLQPFAYGTLTVRILLDTIEHCMREFDFPDPYLHQKKQENEEALKQLKSRIMVIDELEGAEKIKALVLGVLSGNMFDWGAQEVATLMETTDFGFAEAQAKIPGRPWLQDNLDDWIERLQTGPPHKCAAIFVDNSGVDIVLGILPFARDLLQRGTKVIVCANSMPALNDVTYPELVVTLRDAAKICKVIKHALKENRLIAMETAQAGPCLDLSRLNIDLCLAMVKHNVDLIILEGMGRTLHTNLYAKMTCECLKLAVVKNQWLALRLGGDMYAVICKYEQPPPKTKICDIDIKEECPLVCAENKKDVCTCEEVTETN